jgi:hypothetical protein
MLLSPGLVTHWFSSHQHHLISNIISLLHLALRRVTWPSFRLSPCLFLVRPLGYPRVVFQLSFELLGRLSQGLASHLTTTRCIWSEWAWAWWPPWSSIVLTAFGCLSRGPVSRLTVTRTIWSEWTRSGKSPLTFCKFPLRVSFRTAHIYCTLCI